METNSYLTPTFQLLEKKKALSHACILITDKHPNFRRSPCVNKSRPLAPNCFYTGRFHFIKEIVLINIYQLWQVIVVFERFFFFTETANYHIFRHVLSRFQFRYAVFLLSSNSKIKPYLIVSDTGQPEQIQP